MQPGLICELPEPDVHAGDGSPFQSRQAFEVWLKQFKVTTPEQTAEVVSSILRDMNATRIPVTDRLYALTRLFGYVTLTAELFSEHSARSNDDQLKKLATQQSVLELFGQGCCLVVQHLLAAEDRNNPVTTNLARAIHLAISSYSQLMIEGYASHFVGADGAWKYVNKLYLLAEQLGLADLDTVDQSSIQHCYLRIAVVALSNPYHLMPGEARLLYKRLDEWVIHAELVGSRTASISGTPFVDLAKPNPPVHLRKSVGWQQLKPQEGRLIKMDKLIKGLDNLLHSMLVEHQRNSASSSLNQRIQRDFFLRLRDAWGERRERQSQRDPLWQEIEIATGLSAVNFYMRENKTEDISVFLNEDAEQSTFLSDSQISMIHYDKDQPAASRSVWSRIDMQDEMHLHASQLNRMQEKYPLSTWLQCDISEGGLAVCNARDQARFSGSGELTEDGASFTLPEKAAASVKVGDLIAYRTRNTTTDRWEVGAIRWMRVDRRTGVKFGIMRITREAEATKVRAITGVGAGSAHGDALLVNDKDLFGGTIITPAAIYDIGTRLELAEASFGRKLITLSRQILSSAKFSLFEFQTV